MLTARTRQISYSWEEFGNIVETLVATIEEKEFPSEFVAISKDKDLNVLVSAMNASLKIKPSKDKQIRVALNNVDNKADVVVICFTHTRDEFQLPQPSFYFDQITIDENDILTNIVYPWNKQMSKLSLFIDASVRYELKSKNI